MTLTDRRRRRSPYTAPALALQLDWIRREFCLEAIALLTPDGQLMAFAGSNQERARWFSTLVTKLSQAPDYTAFEWGQAQAGCPFNLEHRQFRFCGLLLTILATADPRRAQSSALDLALRGVERILHTAVGSPFGDSLPT